MSRLYCECRCHHVVREEWTPPITVARYACSDLSEPNVTSSDPIEAVSACDRCMWRHEMAVGIASRERSVRIWRAGWTNVGRVLEEMRRRRQDGEEWKG